MKPAFLLTAAAAALLGVSVLAANGSAPAAPPAQDTATQRQGAGTPQNQPATANAPVCNGSGYGRGYCGGRGSGGGMGMGMGRGPMMGRGMRQGPQDGTGPRRDGSCMGS